jgi:uncharacterized membrane protein
MNAIKIVGIVLIIAGIIALAYGHFSYTSESHDAKIGKLELSVKEKETVHVPPWAGWIGIGVGALLLVLPIPQRT